MYYTTVTLGIFALILVLVRLKVPLWGALFISTSLGGLLFGMGPAKTTETMFFGAIQMRTVGLVIITLLILTLSGLMKSTGLMDEIVALGGQILRRPAVLMAALPALIGLLPMPGGALFSAPMVKSATKQVPVRSEEMSTINYWYRHIWEHWWPLYPGVMLSVTLTGLSLINFAKLQIPLSLFMVSSGVLLYRNTHPDLHSKSPKAGEKTKRKFLLSISPIWILLLVWVPVSFLTGRLLNEDSADSLTLVLGRYLPLTSGLIVSIISVMLLRGVKFSGFGRIICKKGNLSLEITVAAVMVFQYMLLAAGAADKIAEELLAFKVPVVLVVAILPMIAGLVTGLAIGFVGTSFPIILALVSALPDSPSILPYISLAYGFGHLGMMLSPIHICYIVTNEYFKTGFSQSYRRMWPAFAVNFTLVAVYFVILKNLI